MSYCTTVVSQMENSYYQIYQGNISASLFNDNSLMYGIVNSGCANQDIANIITDISLSFEDGGSPIQYAHEVKVVQIFDQLIVLRDMAETKDNSASFVLSVDNLLNDIALFYPQWVVYDYEEIIVEEYCISASQVLSMFEPNLIDTDLLNLMYDSISCNEEEYDLYADIVFYYYMLYTNNNSTWGDDESFVDNLKAVLIAIKSITPSEWNLLNFRLDAFISQIDSQTNASSSQSDEYLVENFSCESAIDTVSTSSYSSSYSSLTSDQRRSHVNALKYLLVNDCNFDLELAFKIYDVAMYASTHESYMDYIENDDYSGGILQVLSSLASDTSDDVIYALTALIYVFSQSFPELGDTSSVFNTFYVTLGVDAPTSLGEAFQDYTEDMLSDEVVVDEVVVDEYIDEDVAIECPTLPSSIRLRGTLKTREGLMPIVGMVNTSTGEAKLEVK